MFNSMFVWCGVAVVVILAFLGRLAYASHKYVGKCGADAAADKALHLRPVEIGDEREEIWVPGDRLSIEKVDYDDNDEL